MINLNLGNRYWIRGYNKNKEYLGTFKLKSGNVITGDTSPGIENFNFVVFKYSPVKYIRIAQRNESDTSFGIESSGFKIALKIFYLGKTNITLDNVYERKMKEEYQERDIYITYDISRNYKNKGCLKLPKNYSRGGEKVPLVIFIHGSADYGKIDSVITTKYMEFYNYIRDSGYALFDCYGYGTKYSEKTAGYANTWGIPLNDTCYVKGVEFILENYNIDRNNIFVACKSLGGLQAMSFFVKNIINVKAFGLLSPELNILNVYMGYESMTKKMIAKELNFSEDVNGVLNFRQGESIPEGFYDYLIENLQKWVGVFGYMCGVINESEDDLLLKIKTHTGKGYVRRLPNTRIKIWIAEDDLAVSYESSKNFIESLNRSGCHGELRTMPKGTGGHHSVDTDENALKKVDVTTNLGIKYESIPLAYYELVEWFDSFLD